MGSLRKAAGLMVPILGGGFIAACALGLLFAAGVSIFEGHLGDGALLAGFSGIALVCSLFIFSELGWRRKFLQATKTVFHVITLPVTAVIGLFAPPKSFRVRGLFQFIAVCLVLGGSAVFSFQIYTWLKYGYWPPYSLNYFISAPELSWRGVEKIVAFALKCPVSLALIAAGVATIAWFNDAE